jgi:hypothetical protein
MDTRIVHTRFWSDNFVSQLNFEERALFMYFLTNSHINLIHCYELPDRDIMRETGCTQRQLDIFKSKVEAAGKIFFYKGWITMKNFERYNRYTGRSNELAKAKQLNYLSQEVRDWRNAVLEGKTYTPVDTPPSELLANSPQSYNHNHYNKGDSKGGDVKAPASLGPQLTAEDLADVAEGKRVSLRVASSHYELLKDYCLSSGRVYKDYKAALRNFIQRSIDDGKTKQLEASQPLILTERA